ncbi:HAD-IIIA family hydrolase [Scytonema sp. UIC 10036]|uniref:KdsC family phosphatase n=1 Tax=Scytonema sp. UIC 10036 TaxID=2304196 RepID=UPI0012DAA15B|nr:HAD-IIIA family hydrolase [Scytonema sp. UIC 10036]MUG96752.1 HAD-IIIA family hydrolase [Scytonema sp. UIC 10036]
MSNSSNSELQERLSQVKLLALDVDGVLTDGGLYYTDSGEELKKFNVKDGQGIKLVMQAGVEVAIVTTSTSNATLHRAKKLGIKYAFIGIEDKLTVLKKLCEDLSLSLSQVAYVGDDVVDLPIMRVVGCPMTVADAMPQNKACAIYVTQLNGGAGCVREICNLLLTIKSEVVEAGFIK